MPELLAALAEVQQAAMEIVRELMEAADLPCTDLGRISTLEFDDFVANDSRLMLHFGLGATVQEQEVLEQAAVALADAILAELSGEASILMADATAAIREARKFARGTEDGRMNRSKDAWETDDSFWNPSSVENLAAQQGVQAVADPSTLTADFWPEDDIEDFLSTLGRWRQEQ